MKNISLLVVQVDQSYDLLPCRDSAQCLVGTDALSLSRGLGVVTDHEKK